jgi:hypothetical protein
VSYQDGALSDYVTVAYSGSGSSASVVFSIKTDIIKSNAFYLKCLVAPYTSDGNTCSYNAFYIQTN